MKIFRITVILVWIFACTNDSENWELINTNIREGLHDIEIIDRNTLIAYGYGTGNVFKSVDGGNNWAKLYQFDSLYFEQIQFLNDSIGWIIGSPNKIYKTKDGGVTWIDKSFETGMTDPLIYGMYFKNIDSGYIAINQFFEKKALTNIYGTIDSGNSWHLLNSLNELILNLEEINGNLYGTGNNIIIKDIDRKDDCMVSFKDSNNIIGQIRDIEINKEGQVMAVSFNGYILEFFNGEWTYKRITKNRLRSVVSYNTDKWIAVGDSISEKGNVFMSTDNGKNWNTVNKKFPNIHRINKFEKRIWIVGKGGFIAHTDL